MLLHEIKTARTHLSSRVGRGGKRGTTSGRGQKGQKAHAGRRIHPAQRDLIQRLPKLRGYKNKPKSKKLPVINLYDLERLETIPRGVKILGNGVIRKAIVLPAKTALSKTARAKIEKAGGTVRLNAKSQ